MKKVSFLDGFLYQTTQNQVGICVDEARRHTPYFAVYDCETCQENLVHRLPFRPLQPTALYSFPTEDPLFIPRDVKPFYRFHWPKLRTQQDPAGRFCVVRDARLPDVRRIARWLAEKQTGVFHLYVRILCKPKSGGRRLSEEVIVYYPFINGEASYEACAEKLLTHDYLKEYYHRVAALRIECVDASETHTITEQHLVSVAVATNLAGVPAEFLCRSNDDEPESTLVHRFADHLHNLQSSTAKLMRERFAPELSELAERIASRSDECRTILTSAINGVNEKKHTRLQEVRKQKTVAV